MAVSFSFDRLRIVLVDKTLETLAFLFTAVPFDRRKLKRQGSLSCSILFLIYVLYQSISIYGGIYRF